MSDGERWKWNDKYGDEGGEAVLEGAGSVPLLEATCSTDEIDPFVRAMTEAAPEMAALLRYAANADPYEENDVHRLGDLYAGEWMDKVKALLKLLNEAKAKKVQP